MASYLHPGVYVEEIPAGSATLAAGATAVAAFVGFTRRGRRTIPMTRWASSPAWRPAGHSSKISTVADPGATLPHSVYGWFNNGGSVATSFVAHVEPAGEQRRRSRLQTVRLDSR